MFAHLNNPQQAGFLAAYVECATVTAAAKAFGVSRETHYRWMANPEYAKAFEHARQLSATKLEEAARQRAIEGMKVFKFDAKGNPLKHPETGEPYYVLRFSDQLLLKLLAANAPEKFGDKIEQTHKGQVASPVTIYMPENGRDVAPVDSANGHNGHDTNGHSDTNGHE